MPNYSEINESQSINDEYTKLAIAGFEELN